MPSQNGACTRLVYLPQQEPRGLESVQGSFHSACPFLMPRMCIIGACLGINRKAAREGSLCQVPRLVMNVDPTVEKKYRRSGRQASRNGR